jgi:hypothetical protein
MTELLIHSMSEFSDLILRMLELADAREIVEIGAEYGGMSNILAKYCFTHGGRLTSIDPNPKPGFEEWLMANPPVRHLKMPSIRAFAALDGIDAWIIDGDHNWYTVYHELIEAETISRRDSKPLLVFLHDIAWPCGRRDAYYAPEQIPPEYRQAHCYEGGARIGESFLTTGRGFRGLGQFAFAKTEGGPRNGVLTAVEDFMAGRYQDGREFGFAEIPAVFGLGILFDLDAPWSNPLSELVLPFHQNRLLRSLEENRLCNYLRVVEMQDDARAGCPKQDE